MSTTPALSTQDVAEELVKIIEWRSSAEAFCICPAEHLHSTVTARSDCSIVVQTLANGCVPGVYCRHDSCKEECHEASSKLRSALRTVAPDAMPKPTIARPRKPKRAYQPATLARIAAKAPYVTRDFLRHRSPIDPATVSPERFFFSLYRAGEKVLVFDNVRSQGQAVWTCPANGAELDEHKLDGFKAGKALGVWFLLHPVTGQWMPKPKPQNGRTRRSACCVTSWRYILFESDLAPEARWLAAVAQLPLRIAAIYTSGGKSVHVLVRLDTRGEQEWREAREKLRELMVPLGADEKSNTTGQLTRLPGCERLGKEDKAGNYLAFAEPHPQELLWLDDAPDLKPIVEKGVLRG